MSNAEMSTAYSVDRECSGTASASVLPGSAGGCRGAHQEAPQTPKVCMRHALIMGAAYDGIVHREVL